MDEREFSERVAAMERKLYRVSFALLRSDADCADAVQEALLKAWRALAWLRREEYFETWLTRIAINECRRILRMRRHALELDARLPAPEPPDVGLRDALMALDVQLRLPVGAALCERVRHSRDGAHTASAAGHCKEPAVPGARAAARADE